MNLTIEQARELGEALLDACDNCLEYGTHQGVAFLDDTHAIAMPIENSSYLEAVTFVVTVLI